MYSICINFIHVIKFHYIHIVSIPFVFPPQPSISQPYPARRYDLVGPRSLPPSQPTYRCHVATAPGVAAFLLKNPKSLRKEQPVENIIVLLFFHQVETVEIILHHHHHLGKNGNAKWEPETVSGQESKTCFLDHYGSVMIQGKLDALAISGN